MAKRIEIKVIESKESLKALLRKEKVIYKYKRLLWLLLLKEDPELSRQSSSEKSGVNIRTQERWIKRYNSGGVDGLLTDAPNTKKSKIITQEIHKGLEKRANSSTNPFLGYWDAQNWVLSQYGVEITYHWVRLYLIKHFKTKLKTPRKSHYKKEEQAIEAFLKTSK